MEQFQKFWNCSRTVHEQSHKSQRWISLKNGVFVRNDAWFRCSITQDMFKCRSSGLYSMPALTLHIYTRLLKIQHYRAGTWHCGKVADSVNIQRQKRVLIVGRHRVFVLYITTPGEFRCRFNSNMDGEDIHNKRVGRIKRSLKVYL